MVAIILLTLSSFSFAQSTDVQSYRDDFSQRVRAATGSSEVLSPLGRVPAVMGDVSPAPSGAATTAAADSDGRYNNPSPR